MSKCAESPVDELEVLRRARHAPRVSRAAVVLAGLGVDPLGEIPPGSLDRAVALWEAACGDDTTDLDAAA